MAAYLVHRDATGLSFASLAMDRKAISFVHRRAGLPSPTASEGVKMTMAGVRNRAAERGRSEPRQARGLREAGLRAIVDTAHIPRIYPSGRMESPEAAILRGAVDIAIASVMRDALLRRGEAAALRWADVEFRPDGSSRITIRRSKTSNRSVVLFVGVRATAALNRTRSCNPIPDARVFGVRRGRTISTRIVTMCREAGLGDGFSRTLAQGGDDAGSRCARGRPCRDHERRAVEVRTDARPLLAGRGGWAGGGCSLPRRGEVVDGSCLTLPLLM